MDCCLYEPGLSASIDDWHQVMAEIINVTERLASTREELQVVKQELLEKNEQLQKEELEQAFIRVREEVLAVPEQGLLNELKALNQQTAEHKQRASEEDKRFVAELSAFTTQHSLWGREGRRGAERERVAALEEGISQMTLELEDMDAELLELVPMQQQNQTLTEEIASQRAHIKGLESERREVCEATERLHRKKEELCKGLRTDREFVRLQKKLQAYREESAWVT